MIRVELREMEQAGWGRHADQRIAAPFGGHWGKTLDKIDRELEHLGAGLVVIEVTGPRVEFRRDGWPTARSLLDPPVSVSFESDHGPLRYQSDRYQTWQTNVHAVALTLERLRAVERYGCATSGEQYTGWAALPAKTEQAYDPVEIVIRLVGAERDQFYAAPALFIKEARVKTHPDRTGTRATYDIVNEAASILGVK